MKNPNSKKDLLAITERLFEEIYEYRNGDGEYKEDETMDDRDVRLTDNLEKIRYEFENGSK